MPQTSVTNQLHVYRICTLYVHEKSHGGAKKAIPGQLLRVCYITYYPSSSRLGTQVSYSMVCFGAGFSFFSSLVTNLASVLNTS